MAIGNAHVVRISRSKRETSIHARKRMAQRGVASVDLRLVLAFGEEEHDGRGGVRYTMTTTAMERLRSAVGHTAKIDGLAGVYAVVCASDGTVITVGHRYN